MYVIRAKNTYGKVYGQLSADKSRLSSIGATELSDAHIFKDIAEVDRMTAAFDKAHGKKSNVVWELCTLKIDRIVGTL